MLTKITMAALAAGAFAAALSGPTAAQQPSQAERERAQEDRERFQAERERAQEDRERLQAERERMQEELERAKAELEAAAREVARLSSELAAPVVRQAMENVRFARQRAMLGIGTDDDPSGVRITAVTPNGPADRAGLQRGDVIVAIDGAALPTGESQSPTAALLMQMEHVRGGESVRLDVRAADGAPRTVEVQARTLGEAFWRFGEDFDFDFDFDWADDYHDFAFFHRGAENAWRSMELTQLTPELGSYFGTDRGVLVVRGPDREGFGLQDGDVILDIGGREPTSPEHAMRILRSFEPGETLRMTIMRRQRHESLVLPLPAPERSATR